MENYNLKCEYCLERGVCIQCDSKNCQKNFHVRCAIVNNLIREGEKMKAHPKDEYLMYVFC